MIIMKILSISILFNGAKANIHRKNSHKTVSIFSANENYEIILSEALTASDVFATMVLIISLLFHLRFSSLFGQECLIHYKTDTLLCV